MNLTGIGGLYFFAVGAGRDLPLRDKLFHIRNLERLRLAAHLHAHKINARRHAAAGGVAAVPHRAV